MRYLEDYKTFDSLNELNSAIKAHIYAHNFELTATDRNILTVVARHAVKYLGAAHLKASTIAEAVEKSEKTVRRALNKLHSLGIVRKVATIRKIKGGQGANIYAIQPNDQAPVSTRQHGEKPCDSENKQPKNEKETNIFLNLNNNIINNTYSSEPVQSTYNRFKSLVNSYINDRKLANKMYGVWLAQTKHVKEPFNLDDNDLLNAALLSITTTFQATKQKKIRNVVGYFNGVLGRNLERLYL